MGEWTNRISTALIATVVTLLIWTWAAEKTREELTISGAIRFVVGEGQPLSVEPAAAVTLTMQVKGSRLALQRAAAMLEHGAELRLGVGGVPSTPGTYSVDVARAFSELPEILRSDLSVISVRPDTVTMTVGRLVTKTLPIVAEIPLALTSGTITIEPAEATLTLPESLADSMPATKIEAFVDVRNLEIGRRHTLESPLRLPEALAAARTVTRLEPLTAKVTFMLVSRDRTAVVPTVPVQVAGPPSDLRNYEVQVEGGSEFLRNVTVSGPGEAISQIESGRARIAAIVHFGADDLARRSVTKPVSMWLLPPGVTVTRIGNSTDTAPLVPFRITERPRSAAPAVEPATVPPRN